MKQDISVSFSASPEDAVTILIQPDLTSQDDEQKQWGFGEYYRSLENLAEPLTSAGLILKCMVNQITRDEDELPTRIDEFDLDAMILDHLAKIEGFEKPDLVEGLAFESQELTDI